MFGPILDLPTCDVCRPGELCDKPVAVMADGSTIRHDTPPHPVAAWPCCPWRHEALWVVHNEFGGEQDPAMLCEWAVARGVHRRRLTAGGALLLREYLALRRLPRQLARNKSWSEVTDGGG